MSLYNMLHGVNQIALILLAALEIEIENIPRFRDCWYDGEHIVIYTRTGGGNRLYYDSKEELLENYAEEDYSGPFNSDLRANPSFVKDQDDDYDSTYAEFFFNVPESLKNLLQYFPVNTESSREKWEKAMEDIKQGKHDEKFKPLFEKITKVLGTRSDVN